MCYYIFIVDLAREGIVLKADWIFFVASLLWMIRFLGFSEWDMYLDCVYLYMSGAQCNVYIYGIEIFSACGHGAICTKTLNAQWECRNKKTDL